MSTGVITVIEIMVVISFFSNVFLLFFSCFSLVFLLFLSHLEGLPPMQTHLDRMPEPGIA